MKFIGYRVFFLEISVFGDWLPNEQLKVIEMPVPAQHHTHSYTVFVTLFHHYEYEPRARLEWTILPTIGPQIICNKQKSHDANSHKQIQTEKLDFLSVDQH